MPKTCLGVLIGSREAVGAVERKGRHFDCENAAIFITHSITAHHHAAGAVQRHAEQINAIAKLTGTPAETLTQQDASITAGGKPSVQDQLLTLNLGLTANVEPKKATDKDKSVTPDEVSNTSSPTKLEATDVPESEEEKKPTNTPVAVTKISNTQTVC